MRQLYGEGIGVGWRGASPSDRLEGDGDAQPDQRGESLRQDSVCIAVNLEEGIEIQMRYSCCPIKLSFGVFSAQIFERQIEVLAPRVMRQQVWRRQDKVPRGAVLALECCSLKGLFLRSPQALPRVFFPPAPDAVPYSQESTNLGTEEWLTHSFFLCFVFFFCCFFFFFFFFFLFFFSFNAFVRVPEVM